MSSESGSGMVSLSGPVTLYESSEVRDQLLAAVVEGRPLTIDLEASGPWDVAGLQLLLAVAATGKRQGFPVHLVRVPGVCREVAERSGLGDWLALHADSYA